MSILEIGDVLEIIQTWDAPLASVAQNVWHLEMIFGSSVDSDGVLAAVLTQQQVAFAQIAAHIGDEYSIVLIEARQWDFNLDRFDGVGQIVGTGMVGTSIVDYEPHGVAGLGRIFTATPRRQGRTFVPGFDENSIGNGVLTPTVEANLALYLATFDTLIGAGGGSFAWCTFNVEPASPLFESTSQAAGVVAVNSLPSYLSKRKPGVGL